MGKRRKTDKHLPERVYLKHGGYYYVTPESKWILIGSSLPQAMGKWAELVGEPKELNTMADVIDRYILEVLPAKKPKTQKEQGRQIQNLRRTFGHMKPREIEPPHIYAYRDKRSKKGPVAANREKSLLSHLFTKAIEWGAVRTNPCREIPRLTERSRDRYIEDKEFEAIYQKAPAIVQCAMDFSYMTGMGIGDILGLRIKDISENEIRYRRQKTELNSKPKTIAIALTPELKAVIERTKNLPKRLKSITHLFRNQKGQPYTYDGFSTLWQRVRQKAGINDIHFHDIRAKAITDKEKLEGREAAQKMGGHYVISTTDIYVRNRKEDRVIPNKKIG